MLSRLFALVVLLALMAGGLYYWKLSPRAAGDLGSVGRQLKEAAADTAITASVKTALRLNRRLKPFSIDVSTEEAVVVLRGEVPHEEARTLAERTAAAVPDVRQVVNHLQVRAGAGHDTSSDRTLGESVDDQALEVQVRLALSLRRELKGSAIDVQAYRREVSLSGKVATQDDRRIAVEVARETAEAKAVVDKLQVGGEHAPDRLAAAQQALAANAHLGAYKLAVREEGTRLVLTGRVHTGAEKDLAGMLVREASGGPIENAVEVKP